MDVLIRLGVVGSHVQPDRRAFPAELSEQVGKHAVLDQQVLGVGRDLLDNGLGLVGVEVQLADRQAGGVQGQAVRLRRLPVARAVLVGVDEARHGMDDHSAGFYRI